MYANLQGYTKFKAGFHRLSIKVRKDPSQKWYNLPYLAMNDAINAVLDTWPAEWHTTTDLAIDGSKSDAQKKKEANLKMAQLVDKRKKEAAKKD